MSMAGEAMVRRRTALPGVDAPASRVHELSEQSGGGAMVELPPPVALASGYEIARTLDVDRRQAVKLAESGLLGTTYRSEGAILVQQDRLPSLAARPFLTGPHPPARVVRVAPARPDEVDTERDFLGWHADLPQQVRWDGTRGWWAVKHPEDVKVLVVVLCTFIVEVFAVTGFETGLQDKHRFEVLEAPRAGRPFRGKRLRTPPGGSTVLLAGA